MLICMSMFLRDCLTALNSFHFLLIVFLCSRHYGLSWEPGVRRIGSLSAHSHPVTTANICCPDGGPRTVLLCASYCEENSHMAFVIW